VLVSKDTVDTLIFDEIDTGVSGSAAEKIALKLYSVSKGRQVICVTHLARIAAQADNHLKIYKEASDGITYTKVKSLDFNERAEELAGITAGNSVTQLQISSAAELLKKVRDNS
ncbi:MAG: DNA repair protein RecN, partial [Clostridia bacterium]|nr:DNA repair protein RecN [Clostridia bacterium]